MQIAAKGPCSRANVGADGGLANFCSVGRILSKRSSCTRQSAPSWCTLLFRFPVTFDSSLAGDPSGPISDLYGIVSKDSGRESERPEADFHSKDSAFSAPAMESVICTS